MIELHIATSAGPRFSLHDNEEELRKELIYYHNEVLPPVEEDECLPEDATLQEAIDAIQEYEEVSWEEHDSGVIRFDPEERDVILAALRVYQDWRGGATPDAAMVQEIETNGGKHAGMDDGGIDRLCERLNT